MAKNPIADTQDMLVVRVVSRADSVDLHLDTEADGPWITVRDGALPRRPRPGDVVRVQLPKVLCFVEVTHG